MPDPTASPQLDYDEPKQAAWQAGSAGPSSAATSENTEKASSSVSLVLMMTLAACLGFGVMQIDFGPLIGDAPGGKRHAVWRKMMNGMGVDVEHYRAERQRKYGSAGQFANEGAINDMQMFITDAMGPQD